MMQKAIVANLDFQWPRFVGTKQALLDAVQIGRTVAFEDVSLSVSVHEAVGDFPAGEAEPCRLTQR